MAKEQPFIDARFTLLGSAAAVFRALEQSYASLKIDPQDLTPEQFCNQAMSVARDLEKRREITSSMLVLTQLHVIAQKISGRQLGSAVKLYVSERFTQELL